MQFTHYGLGNKSKGDIVEIILSGSTANVRLMDSSNLQNYRNGRVHKYFGGLAKRSPIRLQIPNSGHWVKKFDILIFRIIAAYIIKEFYKLNKAANN